MADRYRRWTLLLLIGLAALLLLIGPLQSVAAEQQPAAPSSAATATSPDSTDSPAASHATTSDTAGTTDASASASAAVSTGPSEAAAAGREPVASSVAVESAADAARRKREEAARDAKYVVGLLSSMPRLPGQTGSAPGARSVVMTAKSGRRFRCVLPDPAAAESNLLAAEAYEPPPATVPATQQTGLLEALQQIQLQAKQQAAVPVQGGAAPAGIPSAANPAKPSSPVASSASASGASGNAAAATDATGTTGTAASKPRVSDSIAIPRLIRKHLGQGCFTQHVDYWSYEVCPFRSVRQYHRDAASQTVTTEFSLGLYVPPGDAVTTLPGGVIPPVQGPAPVAVAASATGAQSNNFAVAASGKAGPGNAFAVDKPMLYTQIYEGGSNNRDAVVRFLCNPDPHPAANTHHLLLGVREPRVGHYEFDIRTTLLCRDEEGHMGGGVEKTVARELAAAAKGKAAGKTGTPLVAAKKGTEDKLGAPEGKGAEEAHAHAEGEVETGRMRTGPRHRAAAGGAAAPSSGTTGAQASGSGASSAPHVMDLLDPLGNECLYLNTGWWTYKFCYLREISQFHREAVPLAASAPVNVPPPKTGARSAEEAAANMAEHHAAVAAAKAQQAQAVGALAARMQVTAEFILGRLSASAPVETLESLAHTRVVQGATWEDSYVSQQYSDGTICDLSGKPRQTETRLYCSGEDASSSSSLGIIRSVTEAATCQYIVNVATPLLCKHPLFRPKVPSLIEIACTPIDEPDNPAATHAAAGRVATPAMRKISTSGDARMLLVNVQGGAHAAVP